MMISYQELVRTFLRKSTARDETDYSLARENAADRDAAQKALSDIMKQIEFDVTAADLAYLLNRNA